MKKIIISGSNGFIGRKLINKFNDQDYIFKLNHSEGRDICNVNNFPGEKADYFIHLAGVMRFASLEEMIEINVNGTINVLEYCKKHNSKLIFASSAAIYGDISSPIKEDDKKNPKSNYALTKSVCEKIIESCSKNYNISATILRIFNPYGENQKEGFLIPDIIKQIGNNQIILRSPSPKRDFVHIEDCVNAFEQSLNLEGFNIINIGSGVSYSVDEVAKLITNKSIKYKEQEEKNASNIYADISKAKRLLKWEPTISLEEGLKKILIEK